MVFYKCIFQIGILSASQTLIYTNQYTFESWTFYGNHTHRVTPSITGTWQKCSLQGIPVMPMNGCHRLGKVYLEE